MEIIKEKGDYLIIDELSGMTLVTIHSSEWSCAKEETLIYVNRIKNSLEEIIY